MQTRLALAVPLSVLALAAACNDTFISISSDGRIEVLIGSTGTGFDPDGFTITVDGGTQASQVMASRVILTGLSQGRHSVQLGGLSENCSVQGANPVTTVVDADGTASVAFAVYCAPATTGSLSITVATVGEPADTDGYLLVVGEGGTRSIPNTARERFTDLPAGTHLVMLKNLLQGCALDGGNPQTVVVVGGETRAVALVVRCGGGTQ